MIVDGADNFPTRYLVNDASVWHGIPVVHGSIFRFEGQVTVFKPGDGPCYRCLFPQPPPPELAPSCAEGGVLGVLPGIIGTLQANEALKLLLGIGDPLVGRLAALRGARGSFTEVKLRRDPACPVCGEEPTITEYIDYVEFCLGGAGPGTAPTPSTPPPRSVVTKIRIPPTLRGEVGGAREVEAEGGTMRDVLEDLASRSPASAPHPGRRGHRAVRERLPRQRGRAHARRARDTGRRERDGDPAPGHGRRPGAARAAARRGLERARPDRLDAARRAAAT